MFDYKTKCSQGAKPFEIALLRTIQLGACVSSLWGYRGFGACCRFLKKFIPARALTIMLDDNSAFRIPFADPYWSMLLGGTEIYEPEIEDFLRSLKGEKYTLIDCGANYGYWSVLTSGKGYGLQRVIAIEPSSATFAILTENAAINGNRFICVQKAIGSRPGIARLSGRKHEARTVSTNADAHGESVDMIALDDLIDEVLVKTDEKIVVKFDVEGLEIAALSGAAKLLTQDAIVICEDHGSDRHHTVSQHILEKTGLKLFCHDAATGTFERVANVATLDRIKRFRNRGYNVFATASPYWEVKLGAVQRRINSGAMVRASTSPFAPSARSTS
ncbi:MAG: FkbM family methyltransferase [Rhizobiales bacterium]|nr:FkbM family methyltransferase [Hyphomicrobiales bacterium]